MTPPPAGRPRKNPKAPRVTLAVRVDPKTKALVMRLAKLNKCSAGELIDTVIARL